MNVSNFIAYCAVNCNATNSSVALAENYFGVFRFLRLPGVVSR
jgi:hypothetical protein